MSRMKHCWHPVEKSGGRTYGVGVDGYQDVCCFCGGQNYTQMQMVTKPGHGPNIPQHEREQAKIVRWGVDADGTCTSPR